MMLKSRFAYYFLIIILIIATSSRSFGLSIAIPPDTSIYEKLNGNKGEGPSAFKGVRNLRTVLNGVLYRSGANNNYGPFVSRANDNPLSFQTLLNLRENGFRRAYYLYNSNFELTGWNNMMPLLNSVEMDYKSLVPRNDSTAKIILKDIYHSITEESPGAILVHCWNGWHMSGLVSAYALMQFCNFTSLQAWEYWKSCTDNNYVGFEKIKTRIYSFKPDETLRITDEKKLQICSCATPR